jgi:rod shape-determining protein MreD
MTRPHPRSPRIGRALLFVFGLVAVYLPLIPYSLAAEGGGPPDLLFALVMAWIVRRPDTAPILLVVLLGLLADVLTSRPLGLGALGLVLCAELFRSHRGFLVGYPFLLEWFSVAVVLFVLSVSSFFLLKITFMDGPSVQQLVRQSLITAICYPGIVAVLHWMVGIRAPEARSHRGRLDPLT